MDLSPTTPSQVARAASAIAFAAISSVFLKTQLIYWLLGVPGAGANAAACLTILVSASILLWAIKPDIEHALARLEALDREIE